MAQTLNHNSAVETVTAVALPTFDDDVSNIQRLDDEPNDVGGMTAAQLKAEFDKAGETIADYINDTLIPAVLAQDSTEEARQLAEGERVANEIERVSNENARVSAETSRSTAETSRVNAETARAAAETDRQTAEQLRANAETARANAETGRANAEETRVSNESARVDAESGRVSAESSRVTRESARVSAESERATAETERATAEAARASAENNRASAETTRADNESTRVSNEQTRVSNEQARVSNESGRISAEQTRQTNEAIRQDAETGYIAQARDAAEDSEAWAVGQRSGTDVPATDETYHNNAKYWAGQAEQIVGGDYALRSQIADAETTGTASKAYAIGELFTYNGVFYKATAAIAQGGTITPGTNCAVVVIADEMVSRMDPIGRLLIGSTQPAALTEQNTWIKGRVVESNAPDTLTIGEVLTALGVDWSAYASDNTIQLTVGSMHQGQTVLSGSAYNIKLNLFTSFWNITYSDGVYGGGVADTVYIDIRTQGGTILYSETGCAKLLSALNQVGIIVDEVHRKLGNSTMKVHFSEMDAKADATALTTHTGNSDIHVTAAQKTAWSGKQDALTFDSAPTSGSGNPVTSGGVYNAVQEAGKSPYVYSFSASDWTAGTDDATITIAAATHGFTGSGVLAQFWHQVSGAYLFNTWACIESWAEIDASTHVITLHGPSAGFTGKVVLYG